MLVRYEAARTAVATHLTKGRKSILTDVLADLARKLRQSDTSDYKKTNHKLCTDAIEAFQAAEKKMGIGTIKFRAPRVGSTRLKIAGVSVSVSLDLMTETTGADGNKVIGGTVLVFSKSGGPEKNVATRCQAIAILIRKFLEDSLSNGEVCDPTMCIAVDIFGGKFYRANTHQKRVLKAVTISCEDVTALWPTIKPPANYNGPPIPKI